jgi:hypothetical protein
MENAKKVIKEFKKRRYIASGMKRKYQAADTLF